MAKFLSQAEIYRILQRELPEGLYPDGAAAAYVSTAENDSVAACVSSFYTSMQGAYNNLIVTTADEDKMSDWETTVLGKIPADVLTLEERRYRILARLRSTGDISLWQIVQTVAAYIGPDRYFEIRQRNVPDDVISSQIKGANADLVWAPGWVSGDPAPAGVTVTDDLRNTESSLLAVRTHTYTYDVIVFSDDTFTAVQAQLDDLLVETEPARSAHVFTVVPSTDGCVAEDEATRFNYNGINGYLLKLDSTATEGLRRQTYYFGFVDDDSARGFGNAIDATQGGRFWFSVT
jgi:hypothetical protein